MPKPTKSPVAARVPSPSTEERLLRIREFADLLGVSLRKAFAIVASGTIPVVVLGPRCRRVRLADASRWIDSRRSA